MLSKRYMVSVKNLPAIMQKVRDGTAPTKFTIAHLKGLGFKSSNDLAVIGVLKDLGFLSSDGTPTQRYHAYRDPSRSKDVMTDALREAYEDLFHINEKPSQADRSAILGRFKSGHNVSDHVAELQARTFLALLSLADLNSAKAKAPKPSPAADIADGGGDHNKLQEQPAIRLSGLHYNVQIHLPPTKDVEVYNAIFKSLKEHLLAK